MTDEKSPLLHHQHGSAEATMSERHSSGFWRIPRRIADAVVASLKVVLSTIAAPARYVVACFHDDQGRFSTMAPLRYTFRSRRRKSQAYAANGSRHVEEKEGYHEKPSLRPKDDEGHTASRDTSTERSLSVDSTATSQSESESENQSSAELEEDGPARNTRSKSASRDEIAPAKKSIRIKLHNEEALTRKRPHKASKSSDLRVDRVAAVANSLKSPSSPASATKLKYPRAPAAPRPLVPRRQPSYIFTHNTETPKKTLIIDLDETLIHSTAKGGRMSTGHMVEVRLFPGPIGGSGPVLGPQVPPILYYVHERPCCHEFLRKVCKWYNLIVFTASVQEYADPVIDWLERERKYFSGRYYRQHCTFRNGAYIKDLSHVEPDLSKVMILDNSPMSYIFHEDNAIPIEGWISDPTDNDLLHLVPLLEGLQYVTDVRALLALRLGQAERA
ncbi:NLI interacting factor-like phosphatase-domain-containing protein [Delphinella strobiligena]|nr:NLI interacting factor-like phosphatase-domain-containing protein [Delphinella strobiligena]